MMITGVADEQPHAGGYDGECSDPVTGTYHPGNGYRTYSPTQMRFMSPDDWSPFGPGGINPYMYCAGDPINHADPSGHMSWQSGVGIGLGIAGIATAIFTAGASLAAAGGICAALAATSTASLTAGAAALVADVTGLASAATGDAHPQRSAILGWVWLAAGIFSIGIGLATAGYSAFIGATAGLRSRLVRVNGRTGIPMSGEF